MDPKILIDTSSTLKNLPRTGWLQRGIPAAVAETVAEHSFEVTSILSVIALEGGKGLHNQKLLLMGTVHDWGEAIAGDIPRSLTMRLGKEVKSNAERKIVRELSAASGSRALSDLFEEYEEGKSQEAVVAKVADLISTMRQARAYAEGGYHVEDIIAS